MSFTSAKTSLMSCWTSAAELDLGSLALDAAETWPLDEQACELEGSVECRLFNTISAASSVARD